MVATRAGLRAFARLLREYHDAVAGFVPPDDARWALTDRPPSNGEVICHSDFGPWNVVWADNQPSGLLDFDFAGPGDPMLDVAYGLNAVAPFRDDTHAMRYQGFQAPPDRRCTRSGGWDWSRGSTATTGTTCGRSPHKEPTKPDGPPTSSTASTTTNSRGKNPWETTPTSSPQRQNQPELRLACSPRVAREIQRSRASYPSTPDSYTSDRMSYPRRRCPPCSVILGTAPSEPASTRARVRRSAPGVSRPRHGRRTGRRWSRARAPSTLLSAAFAGYLRGPLTAFLRQRTALNR